MIWDNSFINFKLEKNEKYIKIEKYTKIGMVIWAIGTILFFLYKIILELKFKGNYPGVKIWLIGFTSFFTIIMAINVYFSIMNIFYDRIEVCCNITNQSHISDFGVPFDS